MNSKLTLFWGFLIFLISGILFSLSNNSFISVFYVFISMFCGIFLILFRKDIPVFSPIFMLISAIFINIGFPALYLLINKISFSEELLKNISIVYVIYFFALILPVFFANQMFIPNNTDDNSKTSLFKINFNPENINFYLIISNLLLILLILFLLKTADFSYIEALKHPLDFRFAASAGSLAYIRKLIFFLFMVNTFFLAKYNFSLLPDSPKLKFFTAFHIIFLLIFAAISGSRSIIFLPVISSIAVYTFYNRLKLKTAVAFFMIFLLTFGLISFYSVYRNNSSISLNSSSIFTTKIFAEGVKRLDNFKNSLYFFDYIEKENNTIFYFKDFHVLEQIKNHVLQPFPRNIIPEKGYYFSSSMTEKVFNTDINEAKITYNFGGISNAFWNFGIAGVVLEGLFLGIAVVWLHRKFLKYINYDSFFLFFMATFFFIPNSVIVDGFWNTMDGCGYFLNLIILGIVIVLLSFNFRIKRT
ncbi:MAG: hypothetical protein A2104_07510 [Candidatus Melainabacteria bacterium GWF2_32_7]|nr:MAG: hypothetical protein A2104_07510 [Candidatus Melainabacteria bacterium GWF2_32_7]